MNKNKHDGSKGGLDNLDIVPQGFKKVKATVNFAPGLKCFGVVWLKLTSLGKMKVHARAV